MLAANKKFMSANTTCYIHNADLLVKGKGKVVPVQLSTTP